MSEGIGDKLVMVVGAGPYAEMCEKFRFLLEESMGSGIPIVTAIQSPPKFDVRGVTAAFGAFKTACGEATRSLQAFGTVAHGMRHYETRRRPQAVRMSKLERKMRRTKRSKL